MAVTMSPGLKALPSGMFSAEQTTEMTLTAGLSSAMARMAPIMAAEPAMSYFIFSMLSAGLMEMPPVSKVMPLPTRPRRSRAGAVGGGARRGVGDDDEGGGFGGALRDGAEGAHLELVEFFHAVGGAGESHLVAHGFGAGGEDGGGEDVAGLVDEGAGEVLGVGEDEAFFAAGPDLVHGGFFFVLGDDGEPLDGEVFAVAAVGVPVGLGDLRAFDEGAAGELAGKVFEVFVGEGVVLGEGDGDFFESARLGGADGGSGAFADLVDGEGFVLAEADDEEALGFDAVGGVEQHGLAERGLELAGAEEAVGGVGERVGGSEQDGHGIGVLADGDVDGEDAEHGSGESGCVSEGDSSVHRGMVQRRVSG